MRSSGSRGALDHVGAGLSELVVEVARRQQVGGDHDPLGAAAARGGHGVGHRRLRRRPVAGRHRAGPPALQQGGGVLHVGHRPGIARPRGGQHDRGERVAGSTPAASSRSVSTSTSRGSGPSGRAATAPGCGRHRTGDVDVHVVTAGQQERDDDGRPPLGGQPATTSTTVGGWTSTNAAVVTRAGRSARAARASSAISRRPVGLRVPWAQATSTGWAARGGRGSWSQGAEPAAVDGDQVPVMYEAAGESTKAATRPNSSGRPIRRSGMPASVAARAAAALPKRPPQPGSSGRSIVPGITPSTRMPRAPVRRPAT